MSRLKPVDPETAVGEAKELLNGVQEKVGFTCNMVRTMANGTAVLKGYLNFEGALAHGGLPARLRQQIALTVAETNQSQYCLAAHAAIGKTVGLGEEAILDSRRALSPDSKEAVVLRFARTLVTERGLVSDQDVTRLRRVGYSDGHIAEIIANVALHLFTNYFNRAAGTELDFPPVQSLPSEGRPIGP